MKMELGPIEKCISDVIHEDVVNKVKEKMHDEQIFMNWLNCLKSLVIPQE